ncbi:MAG: DUF502 domain-containing protein [Flavobacteriales bacterium]|jgi:uncharacterized membrane protein|nr:MAG: DUF502 domain-containing protein [Flavobacteriales bacterium]
MALNGRRTGRIVLGFFFRGLLLLVPITVIVWTLWRVLAFLDGIIPLDIPGLGLATLLAIITVVGWLGSTILFQPLADFGDELLQRVPVIKTMYGALKDLMEALVGSKRKFDRPVMVRLGAGMEAHRLGFITQEDLQHLGIGPDMVAVYFPHAFAWSGNLMVVPRANVRPIDAEPADVMKFVVSGGVSKVADE